jgi:hypothetical protein
MGPIGIICAALGTILTVIALVGAISFASTLMTDSVRIANGDSSAASDLANSAADEVVGDVQWSVGMRVIIAIAGVIGVPASIITVLKRNA